MVKFATIHSCVRLPMSAAPRYSVVVPVYNSARILPELHRRLSEALRGLGGGYEIVFVDDCGPQDCWSVLAALAGSDPQVRAIQLMRNAGQGNATLCGLAHARGEFVITMDDDLQHPPEEITRLVAALRDEVDVVMGVPRVKRHHWFRRLASGVMDRANSHFLAKDPALRFSSFRLIRRPVLEGLLQLRTLSPALSPMIHSVTRRIRSVEFDHAARFEGRSGYSTARLMAHAMSNLIGYTVSPLRWLAGIGVVGIALSLGFAVVVLVRYFAGGITVPGWTTIAILLLLVSGFNFFAFAILGEYLLRILQRANDTPQYLVRQRLGGFGPPEEERRGRDDLAAVSERRA